MTFQKLLDLENFLKAQVTNVAVWRNNLHLDRVTTVNYEGKATQTRILPDESQVELQGNITYRRGKEDGGYPVTETFFVDEGGNVTKLDSKRI